MARGRGRGTGKPPAHGNKKQQSRTPSPARKRRKLVNPQSNSETCTTSSEGNAGSKQRAPQNAHKSALTNAHNEETIVEKKTKKSKTKAMKKSDRESLLQSLQSIDENILQCDVIAKLTATFEDDVLLKEFTNALCTNEQPLQGIITHHLHYFAALYVTSKKQQDSFLQFQIDWFKYCSVFLLSEEYSLQDIDYHELPENKVCGLRSIWLEFTKTNGVPVPHCNKVMMIVSSTVYDFLLDHVARFQQKFVQPETVTTETDEDGVYYRFGGATLCSMLHALYKEIKCCSDDSKDVFSQKITILQAINIKDKSSIPGYLQYRDRGFLYFPDPVFLPYLREADAVLKKVVNSKGLNEHGDELIKVAHDTISANHSTEETFKIALSQKLPNLNVFSEGIIKSVYEEFTRKLSNTRIQEFISSTKQQLANKKGLASTVDVNLRSTLLTHHTKLGTKLGTT